MELCRSHASLPGATIEEQQLLLGAVTAPLHGDGMATLVHSATPAADSALLCSGYSGFVADGTFAVVAPPATVPTHTAAGVPLASLVADGGAAAGGEDASGEAADQSFAEFATLVWPKLVG